MQLDLAPFLRADDLRRFDENDALDILRGADIDQRIEAGAQALPHVGGVTGRRRLEDFHFELFGDGAEQALLVGEMMVDRTGCYAGVGSDLVDFRSGIAVTREMLAGDGDERGAGGFKIECSAGFRHRTSHQD